MGVVVSPEKVVRKPLLMAEKRVQVVGTNGAVLRKATQSGSFLRASGLFCNGLADLNEVELAAWQGGNLDHKPFWFFWPRSFSWLA